MDPFTPFTSILYILSLWVIGLYMIQRVERPILVTGSHRSGTTWVGKMLSKAPSVGYIHEPFNYNHRLGVCSAHFDTWFPYICQENEAHYEKAINKTVHFSYTFTKGISRVKDYLDPLRIVRDGSLYYWYKLLNYRPLIKDPIALFSAEWLSEKFNMDVVIMIRHPAAFVSSLKMLKWEFPFTHFLNQPLLMRDYLSPFEDEIKRYSVKRYEVIDQAILLWRVIHFMISKYQHNHTDWIFIRHEELSSDPLYHFKELYNKLELSFTPAVSQYIADHSDTGNPGDPKYEGNLKRNSQSNIWNWKKRLSESKIETIKKGVSDISKTFYHDEEW